MYKILCQCDTPDAHPKHELRHALSIITIEISSFQTQRQCQALCDRLLWRLKDVQGLRPSESPSSGGIRDARGLCGLCSELVSTDWTLFGFPFMTVGWVFRDFGDLKAFPAFCSFERLSRFRIFEALLASKASVSSKDVSDIMDNKQEEF